MKLSEIKTRVITEATKGKWKIGNLNGVYKNFKSEESEDAKAWMKDRHSEADLNKLVFKNGHWHIDPKIQDREDRKADREWAKREKELEARNPYAPHKPTAEDLRDLYNRATEAAASSFPDGDPIDHLIPYLERKNWDTSHIDMAFKKFGTGREKKGWYTYLADMWDDFVGDRMHDANIDLKAGRTPERSPFYDVKDGKVTAKSNPWK